MKSFKEYFSGSLRESFDSKPFPWKKQNKNHYWFEIKEKDVSIIYDVTFEYDAATDQVEVSFTIDQGTGTTKLISLSNTGHQYQVFVTVIDIWKDFVKNNSTIKEYLIISVDNESPARSRVYQKLLKRFLPAEWKMEKEAYYSKKIKSTFFRIIKK
jgi:hypothetical protein